MRWGVHRTSRGQGAVTGSRLPGLLAGICCGLALLAGQRAEARQHPPSATRPRVDPLGAKTLTGEVMSVDWAGGTLVVHAEENGRYTGDVSVVVNRRTPLKKLPTPISGGKLEPGHLVKVTYQEQAGRLVAQRIEVTGKAVHLPMP